MTGSWWGDAISDAKLACGTEGKVHLGVHWLPSILYFESWKEGVVISAQDPDGAGIWARAATDLPLKLT